MKPDTDSQAICYNSFYHHLVDEKRRVQIPAKWRPADPKVQFTVVLWPKSKEGPCLRVLPPAKLAALMRVLEEIPNDHPNKGVLKRVIGGGSAQVTLDKGGRICLPEHMATAAGIKDEAVLVGCVDQFEIWSPERYEKVRASDEVMAQEAFKMME